MLPIHGITDGGEEVNSMWFGVPFGFFGMGYPFSPFGGMSYSSYPYPPYAPGSYGPGVDPKMEVEFLRQQAQFLKSQLDAIEARIRELEKGGI